MPGRLELNVMFLIAKKKQNEKKNGSVSRPQMC